MVLEDWPLEPLETWVATAIAFGVLVAGAALAFPRRVYDEFIWQYFWGPVVADAHGISTSHCAIRDEGTVRIAESATECATASGVIAHPGYTTTSTVAYALILLFAIIGIVLTMQRFRLGTDRGFFYGLVPFVFFGGALRVVEDANATLYRETAEFLIALPWVGFIISPLIYFTVFIVAMLAFFGSRWAAGQGLVSRYEHALAGVGTVLLLGTLLLLAYFVAGTDAGGFYIVVPIITLGGATLITGVVWYFIERYWPVINAGTGFMGFVIIWGHTVDGVANVLSLDWWDVIGLPTGYTPKHVVTRTINDVTASVQPAAMSDLIGTAWPFLPLKVIVAVAVVWVFNEEAMEESPAFSMLLLVAILAVGLGPGTRDFLRATMGI